ncbi:hypothetical protein [Reichenbachiella sp. MALMAid0571]|uniref:hypothetical protein n=1 Tax=Reichenbachiella sp. MALMAid0571 TaxID=3143939 RepID=UPI0032DE94FD
MSEGIFGMVFLFLLEVLPILEKKEVDISKLHWDISTKSYGNIFPEILKAKAESPIRYFQHRNIWKLKRLRSASFKQYALGDDFHSISKLFFKYFSIPEYLDDLASKMDVSDAIGIHFRGTDKTSDSKMNSPITKEEFYVIWDEYAAHNKVSKVFLATDEPEIYNYIKRHYSGIEVLKSREFDHELFWRNHKDPLRNAREAMLDMLVLSKCKTVLKVSSALSAFSKVVNPELEIYRLNASKMFADIPYFPDAYIPLFKKNEKYSEVCNILIDKLQADDWSVYHKERFNSFMYKER